MTASLPVFRVWVDGDAPERFEWPLEDGGVRWEGSESHPDRPQRHLFLVGAATAEDAIDAVQAALSRHARFANFAAELVTDRHGDAIHTPIRKTADEIDRDRVAAARLTDIQTAAVQEILDAAEPTWMILKNIEPPCDEATLRDALADLVERGLVQRTLEMSGARSNPFGLTDWWALTDQGWDLLGLIKSPRYR